jgi:hypothetical protein
MKRRQQNGRNRRRFSVWPMQMRDHIELERCFRHFKAQEQATLSKYLGGFPC